MAPNGDIYSVPKKTTPQSGEEKGGGIYSSPIPSPLEAGKEEVYSYATIGGNTQAGDGSASAEYATPTGDIIIVPVYTRVFFAILLCHIWLSQIT